MLDSELEELEAARRRIENVSTRLKHKSHRFVSLQKLTNDASAELDQVADSLARITHPKEVPQ